MSVLYCKLDILFHSFIYIIISDNSCLWVYFELQTRHTQSLETPEKTAQRKQSDRLQKARIREDETPEQHRGSS